MESGEEFVKLFSQHSQRIYAFIVTLVLHRQDADEVFQNTSLILWKKFESFEQGSSFWAWACQIAYYEALKLRTKRAQSPVLSDEAMRAVAEDMVEGEEQSILRHDALINCLKRLNQDERNLINMRYHHNQRPKAIAELQKRSVHSVYRALTKVHGRLLRCVRRTMSSEGM